MREYVVENEFARAVRKAGGVAYKLNSATTNGLPDRLVLFPGAHCVFVELKAPGKVMRQLQMKRRWQLRKLGFPVICIDRFSQIESCIEAIKQWSPGKVFPEDIGAPISSLSSATLPVYMKDMDDYSEELEREYPNQLAMFKKVDKS